MGTKIDIQKQVAKWHLILAFSVIAVKCKWIKHTNLGKE